MTNRTYALLLGVSVASAAGYALLRPTPAPAAAPIALAGHVASLPEMPAVGGMPEGELPPGHPPIPPKGSPHDTVRGDTGEPAAIVWSVPPSWREVDSPSTMRLATYQVPRAAGDAEDADLSVSRAGGTTDANIERWLGQFDEAGKDSRATRVVSGFTVTTVEVSGTYLGAGMMGGGSAARRPGFSLLAGIVETSGSTYFFKMVGPTRTVKAARSSFMDLLGGLKPR